MSVIIGSNSYIDNADLATYDAEYNQFDSGRQDTCLAKAYNMVNSVLSQKVTVPLARNSNDDYDDQVKNWQAFLTLWLLYLPNHSDKAESFKSQVTNPEGTGVQDQFLKGEWTLEESVTPAEAGIQQAVKGAANSGGGRVYANTKGSYYNDKRAVFTVEITTAGACETAIFKWKRDYDTTWNTSVTTDSEWLTLDNGVMVYFVGVDSASFVVADTWTITCIPEFEKQEGRGTRSFGFQRA